MTLADSFRHHMRLGRKVKPEHLVKVVEKMASPLRAEYGVARVFYYEGNSAIYFLDGSFINNG